MDIKQKYDKIEAYRDGYAVVTHKGEMFHIGKNGEPIYKERYKTVSKFRNGYAIVTPLKSKEEYHIDTNGKMIYKMKFDTCKPFRNGYAIGMKDGKRYIIDTNGNIKEENDL